jgi:hypothetical protein
MPQREKIDRAIAVVQAIEFEVKTRLFPAFDDETLVRHPLISHRFVCCVQNVVDVYCTLQSSKTLESVDGYEARAG